MILTPDQFDELIAAAVADLPPFFQAALNNLAIQARAWPTAADLRDAGVPAGYTLLGLYSGIPLTERTQGYTLVPPDLITLFQGPIEAESDGSPAGIQKQVRHTVIHEIAHHFGISDERLHELGAY